jgi:2'-5' RNA ligase
LRPWLEAARGFAELAVTPVENLHLTLAFLGELEQDAVAQARGAVEVSARARTGPGWQITWIKPGMFPGPSRPRVLWLGVDDTDQRLPALHEAIAAELRNRRLPVEARRFRPHLTLARIRQRSVSRARAEEILDFLESAPRPAASAVKSLVLYRSVLGRGPAMHEALFEAALA